ncbi:MAG: oxygenase MpaB family protein [Solirubrobacterales bacterium]
MGRPLLATDAELDEIILGPDSLVWQRFDDPRLFAAAGYALLLQVAHPTVGAGVRDHSTFEQDPWGRLLRTVDYLYLLTYAGREAAAVGRRLREAHKTIKGTNPDGTGYHALEPEAYLWVHATLLEGAVRAHLRFVGPLSREEIDRIYREYMPLGRLLGIRADEMPPSWPDFLEYFDDMVANRLVHHETVDRVMRSFEAPGRPPQLPPATERLWKLLRIAPARGLRVMTTGLLPPILRERFGLEWSRLNDLELRAVGAASRAAGPLIPGRLRNVGPEYLRWRAKEIARGPLGPGADAHANPGGDPQELASAA